MKISSSLMGKLFGVLILLLIAVAIGYILGTRGAYVQPETPQEPLVKLSYEGGYDPNEGIMWQAIYSDGRITQSTASGVVSELDPITSSQVVALRELINAPDFIKTRFPKKERAFCWSAVDGIDTEIAMQRDNGAVETYSSCEYDLNGDFFHFLTIVDFLIDDRD